MKIKLVYLFSLLLLASCSQRNLVYLSDIQAQEEYAEAISNVPEHKIQPDDLLSITITSLSPEANALFNAGEVTGVGGVASTANISKEGFLVDKDGYIDYPVLGRVKIGGLTKEEVKAKLIADLKPYLNDPIVRMRYLNYKITVIGEVSNPSTFTIPSEKINIIEALGMAGDMTALGKRENVMVMREEEGIRKIQRVNLNSKDVLRSPYFYLQQNDIVYVEPDKAKAAQVSAFRNNLPIVLSVASLLTILLTSFI